MAVITTIRPTTELEAVNVMLGAIGEAKLPADTDFSSVTDANVEQALEILKESTREVLAGGWRFNTLTGLELSPAGTFEWEDTEGVTTTLNIFKLPADILSWEQTPCLEMRGLDLIERRALKYTEGTPPAAPKVLFDRVKNRDGADASTYPKLYIDAVFSIDFEDMPESARRFATVVAARRMAARVSGSEDEARFTEQDILAALRTLKREQGLTKRLNLFHTADANEILGRRPRYGGGFVARVFPGGA